MAVSLEGGCELLLRSGRLGSAFLPPGKIVVICQILTESHYRPAAVLGARIQVRQQWGVA